MMDKLPVVTMESVQDALRKNFFRCECFSGRAEAMAFIEEETAAAQTVGMGSSVTLETLEAADRMKALGKTVIRPEDLPPGENFREWLRSVFYADVFLSGINAVTAEGHIINTDGAGNRVAPLIFGPPKCILVAGKNKLAADRAAGLARIKEAAPLNCQRKGIQAPCATLGYCVDCRGQARSCRATVIWERPARFTEMLVVLIDEDLGL